MLLVDRACLAHTDARDRLTRGPALLRMGRLLRDAPDWSESVAGILRDHGEAMRAASPEGAPGKRSRTRHAKRSIRTESACSRGL